MKQTEKHRKVMIGNKFSFGKNVGTDSYKWKGDSVGYRALHDWVVRYKGEPSSCSVCEKENIPGKDGRRTIQWANKSGKYLRNLDDWVRMCITCHKKHDYSLKEFKKAVCVCCSIEFLTKYHSPKYCSQRCNEKAFKIRKKGKL